MTYPFDDGKEKALAPYDPELRASSGLAEVRMSFGDPAWLVTRNVEVRTALMDQRLRSREPSMDPGAPRMHPDTPSIPVNIAALSGPEHVCGRKVMAKSFTARRVPEFQPRTTESSRGLVDRLVGNGPVADFVDVFALSLPLHVICDMLGVPAGDVGQIMEWSDAFLEMKFTEPAPQQVGEYVTAFTEYLGGIIAARLVTLGEGVMGEMAEAVAAGAATLPEAAMLALGLMVTGLENSSIALANFVYVLDRTDQRRALCDNQHLVPTTVEELLRFLPLSAGAVLAGQATEDVAVDDHLVRAGETVILAYGAANRDEAVFHQPAEAELDREANTLTELTTRMPELRVHAADGELAWLITRQSRGFAELVPRQATFARSRRPARPLATPAGSPSTSSTRTSGRHTESTHRTPLLDGQTLPAAALAVSW
ncbi:cytochrome P450 [Streptomyces leeuwenhoekii]|uniref:cytochrome P450 n=1 Tax=Streptomyces leeuwenhoekii TaxID=1437453 RepID=UPI0012FED16B|nr:cytochrome P450 [Streptomyces leeuwenhoekii]